MARFETGKQNSFLRNMILSVLIFMIILFLFYAGISSLSDTSEREQETTLYSAFTRMEKNNYIESYPGFADNGKRRTYYRITETGRKYYREKCEEWKLTKNVIEHFIRENES